MPKRTDYIGWDQYFMAVALLASQRSKDPRTQTGACLIDEYDHIIGMGYNGFPTGCSDDEFPWEPSHDYRESKYTYVTHAEINCILQCRKADLSGCTMYVTLFPCPDCTKAIIQSGIKEVVYFEKKEDPSYKADASQKMLKAAEVRTRPYDITGTSITLQL